MIIEPSGPVHGREEVEAIQRAAETWGKNQGEHTEAFKGALSEFLGVEHVFLVNSGSSANLAALMALTTNYIPEKRRLKRGDEVITAAMGFPTTVSPIVYAGAVPVFVDVEKGTGNINPRQVEEMITDKTKVIMVAHTLGNPFNLEEIMDLCNKYNLTLIEDNCDSLGSEWKGRKTGSFGHIATSSFYPAHHISTGEGGAVYTNRHELKRALESIINWGRDCFTPESMVTTARGCIPIKDVLPGDKVMTRTGWERVTKVVIKTPHNEMYSIKAYGHKPIETTGDHKIMVYKNGWKWTQARDIRVGDSLRVQTISYDMETIGEDIMYMLGVYLAEGGLIKGSKGPSGYGSNRYYYHAVEFNLCDDESYIIERLKDTVGEHFGVRGNVRRDKKRGMKLRFKSRKLYEFIMENCGTGSTKKFISAEVLQSGETIWSFLKGYFDGDGSAKGQGITVGSSNLGIITQVQSLLNCYSIRAGYTVQLRKKPIIIKGKVVKNAKPLHVLNIYGESRKNLERLFDRGEMGAKDYCEAVVEKIAQLDYQGELYDLSVENSHEYLVNGLLVHNCWCGPGQDNSCGVRYGQQHGDLPFGYDHKNTYSEMGFNLKMVDLQASIGVEQMKRLPGFIRERKYTHAFLSRVFDCYRDWFVPTEVYEGADPCWFGYVVEVSDGAPFTRKEFEQYLDECGIKSRALFCGNITKQPMLTKGNRFEYRSHPDLSVSDRMMENAFWIGVHPGIGDEQRLYMEEVITKFLSSKK